MRQCLLTFLILLVFATCCVSASAQEDMILYFYLNACESCNPEADFADEFQQITGKPLGNIQVEYHNVYQQSGRAAYEALIFDWPEHTGKLPLLIVGGVVYEGDTQVKAGLESHFGKSQSTDSVIYFLTATACQSCEAARRTVDSCPAIIPLEMDGRWVSSTVEIREISISTQPQEAMALFDYYQVPDSERKAPIVFMGETWLAGGDQIEAELLAALKSGLALHTPIIEPAPIETFHWSVWGTAIAGITAGFNPCALSMLLVFTGALLSGRRNPLGYGSLYLTGKLAVYPLIGLFFAEVWSKYAPAWLPAFLRIAATLIGAVLVAVNLADAIHAGKGEYGHIRNQLPAPLRGGIRGMILGTIMRYQKWLAAAVVMLGMAVAAGEFLCAGQLYVAVLIANAGQGMIIPLLVYSVAFLLPSVALLVVVTTSRKTMGASDWLLAHMPHIKFLTAVVMAAVLVWTWLMK